MSNRIAFFNAYLVLGIGKDGVRYGGAKFRAERKIWPDCFFNRNN